MSGRRIELSLWAVAVFAGLTAGIGWNRAVSMPTPVPAGTSASPRSPRPADARALSHAARTVISTDPFRLARRPAGITFGTEPPPRAAAQPPPTPARPTLRLTGIIGGPPWEAILEGVPRRPAGILVRSGDVLGDLHIRRITRDTVLVQGADTTWTLTLERQWHE